MAKYSFLLFLYAYFIIKSIASSGNDDDNRSLHIIYMGSLPKGDYSPTSHHLSMLQQTTNNDAKNHIVRSYHRSFNGFAAMITDQQREMLSKMEGVVSVFPSRTLQLHTTRSWDFMGFQESIQRNNTGESDVIIGVIDTGIWPESKSFNDDGFGPIPEKWKGACEGGKNFTCNNKIIGARHYLKRIVSDASARDFDGHGSHTASTAAGNRVSDASFYGIAGGVARGGAPSARIAVYRVCDAACSDDAILAAFDDSIADGVDVVTISMGPTVPIPFDSNSIAIGSFHAMEKGILTINSAGNSGPESETTHSLSPWIFSVAASTMDRRIIDKVLLGNGLTLSGKSINSFSSNGKKIPLVYGKMASRSNCSDEREAEGCYSYCLDPKRTKGKILLCDNEDGYEWASKLEAFGSMVVSNEFEAQVVSYPSISIDLKTYDLAKAYANSNTTPYAEIFTSEDFNNTIAPIIADFSSRGPNYAIPEIMKPDICAPGIEILAAYSPISSPSEESTDKRSVQYNILSGTSMACPHVAAIAAFVKVFHPDWSPAAIKSSIMTTAKPMNETNKEKEFAYGSGFLDPIRAINPGLVFDLSKDDHVNLLCSIGYDTAKVRLISGDNSTSCPSSSSQSMAKDFNYPAIVARVQQQKPFTVNFTRTVTNVGFANSTYKAQVQQQLGMNITVVPNILTFKSVKEKQSFVVNVGGKLNSSEESVVSSSLLCSDGTHSVRKYISLLEVIDSGIWPESKSFNDDGFGPIPKKWKGACGGGKNFTCNNKIIGARHYLNENGSARDVVGHGSHTASIAAGNKVLLNHVLLFV
ncbi:hypothetical protein PIB30_041289 [Stylosanthes scabra]|uniref:Cucumisin n=1 Tax=Stylosanthes scabra TaxID=79078 RepID=A0ABU6YF50_9FABA|nr:hypothetical protein [Stylosanthes scabra]